MIFTFSTTENRMHRPFSTKEAKNLVFDGGSDGLLRIGIGRGGIVVVKLLGDFLHHRSETRDGAL